MKESHFELPRSQYMESQSQNSRTSKACIPPFGFGSENGDANNEGCAFPFSSPKKIVSWEMVLKECDMNTATPSALPPMNFSTALGPQQQDQLTMPAYRFFPNSFEESNSSTLQ